MSVMTDDSVYLDPSTTFSVIPSGIVTVEGDGAHRTFKISRMPEDSTFMPGVRVVSLLVGSDDWRRFGLVNDFIGTRISVFQKIGDESPNWYAYARMLEAIFRDGRRTFGRRDGAIVEYRVMWARRCFRCSRRLTTPESLKAGIGPDCAAKDIL